jgi:hypothetical protein
LFTTHSALFLSGWETQSLSYNLFFLKQSALQKCCRLWPVPQRLYAESNALSAIAAVSSFMLLYLTYGRGSLNLQNVFLLTGTTVLWGAGCIVGTWALWHPTKDLLGFERVVKAFASCGAALLFMLLPHFVALEPPKQLETTRTSLQAETLWRHTLEHLLNLAETQFRCCVQEGAAELTQLSRNRP